MRIASLLLIVAAGCGGGQTPAAPDAPAAADTWTSWANGFTATYCAASCHAPGGIASREGALDFTMYSKVYANRAEIRCGTSAVALSDCAAIPAPKQFPCSAPYPTDADRMRFVAWIDAGAPQ